MPNQLLKNFCERFAWLLHEGEGGGGQQIRVRLCIIRRKGRVTEQTESMRIFSRNEQREKTYRMKKGWGGRGCRRSESSFTINDMYGTYGGYVV